MKITRRSFLKRSVAASAAFPFFTIAGTKSSSRVLGANDAIHVGTAGIHGQGAAHIEQYVECKNVYDLRLDGIALSDRLLRLSESLGRDEGLITV